MNRQLRLTLGLTAIVAASAALVSLTQAAEPAFPAIDGKAVLEHTKVLASDAFEGRAPGTKGEELTVAYLVEQLRKIGLQPGNPDGSWVQTVPLVGATVQGSPSLTFRKGATERRLAWRDDYVAWTKRVAERVSLDASDLVFVGYGVQAPEFRWDDYKGLDLRGKTMVVLVGDPPVPDPAKPGELDPRTFGGKAMTYYGRWTYKYEMGAKLGAAGVLIVHETEPAGYPFAIVQGKTTEQFDLQTVDGNQGRAAVEGWITLDQAKGLFQMAGQDFEALEAKAATREFRPVPLGATASVSLANTIRKVPSANVAARLEGSDPKLKDEWVIYTTHWDHFGIGPAVNGDTIYRGAIDNASGTAGLLELARAMKAAKPGPARSVLFLFVTAEEQGLLGSAGYAEQPALPALEDAGRPQPRRAQRARPHSRPHDHRPRPLRPRRRRPRGGGRPGARREGRPDAREGLVLPLGPLPLRAQGRALDPRGGRGGVRRPARRLRHARAPGVHPERLPQAVGRGEGPTGTSAARSRTSRSTSARDTRSPPPRRGRSGSRARSGSRGATR